MKTDLPSQPPQTQANDSAAAHTAARRAAREYVNRPRLWVCQYEETGQHLRPLVAVEVGDEDEARAQRDRWFQASRCDVLRLERIHANGRTEVLGEYRRAWRRVEVAS